MEVFESMEKRGHEQVVFSNDPITGLKAIIAIHDTTLGPALGGWRGGAQGGRRFGGGAARSGGGGF